MVRLSSGVSSMSWTTRIDTLCKLNDLFSECLRHSESINIDGNQLKFIFSLTINTNWIINRIFWWIMDYLLRVPRSFESVSSHIRFNWIFFPAIALLKRFDRFYFTQHPYRSFVFLPNFSINCLRVLFSFHFQLVNLVMLCKMLLLLPLNNRLVSVCSVCQLSSESRRLICHNFQSR